MENTPTTPQTEEQVEVFTFPAKEEQLDHYEILLLISGKAPSEQANEIFEKIKKFLTDNTAQITIAAELGRQALGYSVAGSRHGYYFVVEFDLLKTKLVALQESLRVRKDMARFLIVKKRVKTAAELAEEERVRKKIEARKQAKMKADIAKLEEKPLSQAATVPSVKFKKSKLAGPALTTTATATEQRSADSAVAPASDSGSVDKTAVKEQTTLEDIDKEIEKILSDDFDL